MGYDEMAKLLPDEVAGFEFELRGDGQYLFEAWSPTGENLLIDGRCTSPETALDEIKAEVRSNYECYDVDEHVELRAEGRGENGVPGTFRELLEDAEAIGEMFRDLAAAVDAWELAGDPAPAEG